MIQIKKIFIFLCFIFLLTGCSKKENSNSSGEQVNEVAMDVIKNQVANAYGEDYTPNLSYDDSEVKEIFGIDSEWYEEIVAEGTMISTQVDTFLAVKVTKGNAEKVEEALKSYHKKLKEDTMQYPSNQVKIQAAKILSYGDYVFFIMLGYPPMEIEEQGEEALLKAYESENEKAVKAIEDLLLKK